MKDYLIRGITKDKCIRFFAVRANDLVENAVKIHQLSYTNSIILGRTLIAGLLMSMDLKNEKDLLTLKFNGDGPAGEFVVTSSGDNTIKGYTNNPSYELDLKQINSFNASLAVGNGVLNVIRSIGDSKPYIGQVDIVSGEIAEDIAYYYSQSEQIPTAIQLGVLMNDDASVRQAGGFLVQLMPNTPEHIIEKLEENLRRLPNFSDLLDMNYSLEELISDFILKGFGIDIKEKHSVKYDCNCSKERFSKGLALLDSDELKQIVEDNEPISAECHFCNKSYSFSIDELKEILNKR
ncbi:MAG: Hsp33 family molecular chaperone HslO [Candidatus Cloacimonadales bacterium]|jgi:molecular chaperone Hsp33|nr:Hsp33 family molecular chaperone HslO [Candidatus Cloacimonadota bacterium]MDD2651101.1 Hsp33 family molecular chaperone HslO [Candidatus Cloacimonadota bacterium]MDX9978039.1 Hsp33 family molecular chaperone HslO [Candidatus Cloacimonadales bacterium]